MSTAALTRPTQESPSGRMNAEAFMAFADARPSTERWELINGRPRMMTGGTIRHATIIENFGASLRAIVKPRGCMVLRDVYARSSAHDDQVFVPDIVVRCGAVDPDGRFVDDAVLVVEVLSRSTYLKDRGLKMERYVEFPTIEQVILVYQDRPRIESWVKVDGAWAAEPLEIETVHAVVELPRFGASIPVADIYDGALDATG